MNHTINDGLRMVGHLLLHHSTTGAFARDKAGNDVPYDSKKATSFCAIGAAHVVEDALGLGYDDVRNDLFDHGFQGACAFDESPKSERMAFAKQLTEIKEP